MHREIQFNVINKLSSDVTYVSDDKQHGNYKKNPIATIYGTNSSSYNSSGQEVVYIEKTTGSLYGSTGTLTYALPDKSHLILMYNIPYTEAGSGSTNNVVFYALIQSPSGYITPQYCVDSVNSSTPMTVDPPVEGSKFTVTVTIKEL